MTLIHCNECGHPWGVLLERAEPPSDYLLDRSRGELVDALIEEFEGAQFDLAKLPRVALTRVVYITQATADFASDQLNLDGFLEECWQELEHVDLPAWLLKGRKQRDAYRWDCCDIGWAESYIVKPTLEVVR